jgi:hypothetical protein
MLSLFTAVASVCTADVYTVTNTAQSENTTGSMAWALDQANNNLGPDEIHFSIGSGPQTIPVGTLYVYDQVTIDGTTQPGYAGTPLIKLQATVPVSSIYEIRGSGSKISGLIFAGEITSIAIHVDASSVIVDNCWIGADPAFHSYSGNTGIMISDLDCTINHCLIANQQTGIRADHANGLLIQNSAIGTDFSNTHPMPITGDGILVYTSTGVVIGSTIASNGNIVAHCGGDGVGLLESASTIIQGNRIYDCGDMAIDQDLDGPDNNDFHDDDTASNGPQNSPVVMSVNRLGGSITVSGSINSNPSTQYSITAFASKRTGATLRGQGEFVIGSQTVTTDANGDADFSVNGTDIVPSGDDYWFSATAIIASGMYGTSEFGTAANSSFAVDVDETDPTADPGWVHSGVDSGPEYSLDPTSPDDVDVDSGDGALKSIVRPSTSRFRIAGWSNPDMMILPARYDLLCLRGKFYIYTSNAADAPLNTVPNFRIRLEDEGVVLASNSYSYATTGISGPPQEPYYGLLNNPDVETRAGATLRPSSNPAKPSLYRVGAEFPPSLSTIGSKIGATFESYSTEDPANGTLACTEVSIASYLPTASAADPSATASLIYAPSPAFRGFSSFETSPFATTNSGKFNAENDFRPGRRPALDLPGEVPDGNLAQITTPENAAVTMDTNNVPSDKFGVGLFNISSNNNANAPRIRPGREYLAVVILESDMPAEPALTSQPGQGGFQIQLQTAGGALTSRLEVSGPAAFAPAGSRGRAILDEILPGSQCINPLDAYYPFEVGKGGGGYLAIMPSPLDPDIRQDVGGALAPLIDEPGPGSSLPSFRDITVGVNVIAQPTTLRLSDTLVAPWSPPNRAKIQIEGIELLDIPSPPDGGYAY